jgi:hypothetical protein
MTVWTDGLSNRSRPTQAPAGGCRPTGHGRSTTNQPPDQANQQGGEHVHATARRGRASRCVRPGGRWTAGGTGRDEAAFHRPGPLDRGLLPGGLFGPQVPQQAVVLILDGGRGWLRGDHAGGGRGGQGKAQRQHDQRPVPPTHDVPPDAAAAKGWRASRDASRTIGSPPRVYRGPQRPSLARDDPGSTPSASLHTEPPPDDDAGHHALDTSPRWPRHARHPSRAACASSSLLQRVVLGDDHHGQRQAAHVGSPPAEKPISMPQPIKHPRGTKHRLSLDPPKRLCALRCPRRSEAFGSRRAPHPEGARPQR